MANFKNGVIKDGSSPGSGRALGNVKNGVVKNGSSPGSGSTKGKVKDYSIKGGDSMDDTTAVAVYHFLIARVF